MSIGKNTMIAETPLQYRSMAIKLALAKSKFRDNFYTFLHKPLASDNHDRKTKKRHVSIGKLT